MTFQAKIAAYSALLDQINSTLERTDRQITALVEQYQALVKLHDIVSSDLEKLVGLLMTDSSTGRN